MNGRSGCGRVLHAGCRGFAKSLCILLIQMTRLWGEEAGSLPGPVERREIETEYSQRIDDLSEAIEQDPANATLYMRRSRVYADQGEWGKALDDYEMAELLAHDTTLPDSTPYEEELRRGFHIHQIRLVAGRLDKEGAPELSAELIYELWLDYPSLWRLGVESSRLLAKAERYEAAGARLEEVEVSLKSLTDDPAILQPVADLRKELETLHKLDRIVRMEKGEVVKDKDGSEANLLTEKFLLRANK